MFRFVESIRFTDGRAENLDGHRDRMEKTWRHFYMDKCPYDPQILADGDISGPGVWKIRFLYDDSGYAVESHPYKPRIIRSIKLLESTDIMYEYKTTDKSALDSLLEKKGTADDILIVKNGFLTDTSFSNIALYNGRNWFTPEHYLLNGTRRSLLLKKGQIRTARLTPQDLPKFTQISFINAMLDLEESVMDAAFIY